MSSCEYCKIFKKPFFKNICERMVLEYQTIPKSSFFNDVLDYYLCFSRKLTKNIITPWTLTKRTWARHLFTLFCGLFLKLLKETFSHWRCSVRNGFLGNFAKFTGKHLYQSLFFKKIAGLLLWHRCFPVNFTKFLGTYF